MLDLPRLLYVADVPVECTLHGSALIYRLLERYPSGKLRILETTVESSRTNRLTGVVYSSLKPRFSRLLRSRLSPIASTFISMSGGISARTAADECREFFPEAILTVAHGYGWQTAAKVAGECSLPLHMIVHDHWATTFTAPHFVKRGLERRFGASYRQAHARFCVSPSMATRYEKTYGVSARVLYPARAHSLVPFSTPSARVYEPGKPFAVGYAGSINGTGQIESLRKLLSGLAAMGGQLRMYGPATKEDLERRGLSGSNLIVRGMHSSAELIRICRDEVDALVVAVSFASDEISAMETAFPSKLTDYTAVGVPIVVFGPPTCSAVRWVRENEYPAVAITEMVGPSLVGCLSELQSNRDLRLRLATGALKIGEHQFSSASAERILFEELKRNRNTSSVNTQRAQT